METHESPRIHAEVAYNSGGFYKVTVAGTSYFEGDLTSTLRNLNESGKYTSFEFTYMPRTLRRRLKAYGVDIRLRVHYTPSPKNDTQPKE